MGPVPAAGGRDRGHRHRCSAHRHRRAVETLYEKKADGDVDLDAFHDGTAAAYRLLEARNADPSLVWWMRPCDCTLGN
jgi:hypothetical protein